MMKFSQEVITPDQAKWYLAKNAENQRPLKKYLVARYTRLMEQNKWFQNNPEPICFDPDGNLLNGQHTFTAIVNSGKAQQLTIAKDVPPEAMPYLDNGGRRTGGDILYQRGVRGAVELGAIIRTYLLLRSGRTYAGNRGAGSNFAIENEEILEEYERRPKWWQNVINIEGHWYEGFAKTMPPSMIGGFYAFLHHKNAGDAHEFMEKLCMGENLKAADPIYQLRQILLNDKSNVAKLPASVKGALMVKTWNLFRQGSKDKLTFNPTKEDYPKPI